VGAVTPLLERLVDDAGLFPPSNLLMQAALERFRASRSPVLSGRFLCPTSRLDELVAHLRPEESIQLQVVRDDVSDVPADSRLVIRAHELRQDGDAPLPCYVEATPSRELKAAGRFAKLRCGGGAVPECEEVAGFLRECVRLQLPFKATAGLHAAVRGWEHDADGRPHHGFLNLLVAVCAALDGGDVQGAVESTDEDALAQWVRETPSTLARDARALFHSYGSCDTVRPVTDLTRMGLL
jgi:hypothetical protein